VHCQLILGGARSGKSSYAQAFAEEWAQTTGVKAIYVATAEAGDAEMSKRIERHQKSRSENWLLDEEPLDLAAAIERNAGPDAIVLIDCLTLWLSNCLQQNIWEEQLAKFKTALENAKGPIILVNNETGMGVVPMGELSRVFVDANGFLNQRLAKVCGKVVLIVAGLPQVLKNEASWCE